MKFNKKLKFSRKVAYSVILAWIVGLSIGVASDMKNDVNRVFSVCVNEAAYSARNNPTPMYTYLSISAGTMPTMNQIEAYINHLEVICILERLK